MAGRFLPFPLSSAISRATSGCFEHAPFPKAITPPATPEPDELSHQIRAILAGLPGVTLPEAELAKSVAAIRAAVQQTPRRLSLPILKVQEEAGEAPAPAPAIALEKEGDQVTRIKVTCGCGEIITLDCVY
jgi:hypothetical protein